MAQPLAAASESPDSSAWPEAAATSGEAAQAVEAAPSAPQRILLIRPSALGDVARTVPALVTLRRAFPRAQIDWLVHEAYADVVRHHPALSGIVAFPRQRLGGLWRPGEMRFAWRWGRDLAQRRYDWAFDLQGLLRSGLFTWLTRAPRRVGAADAREFAWLAYNRRHATPRRLHTVEHMLRVLQGEGFDPVRDMRLYVGDEDRQWLHDFLQQNPAADEPYATLAPTARWQSKCWPLERYAEIGRRLIDCKAVSRLIVLASPAEEPYLRPLLRELGGSAVCPTTTVGQMMAILQHTRLLVCNDSAPLHVAVGFDRPIVALFGPTDPELVGPYGRPETVVTPPGHVPPHAHAYRRRRDDASPMARISVDRVWEAVQEQLAAPASAPVGI